MTTVTYKAGIRCRQFLSDSGVNFDSVSPHDDRLPSFNAASHDWLAIKNRASIVGPHTKMERNNPIRVEL